MPVRTRALLLACLVLVTGVAGCKTRLRPISYINTMSRANAKLSAAARNFEKSIAPLKLGQPANPQAVQTAYAELAKALQEIQLEYKSLLPPLNSKAAAMHSRYME